MQVNLFYRWKVLKAKAQLMNTNSAYPGVAWKNELFKSTSFLDIQLADFENSLVTNILSFDIEGLVVIGL